MLSSFILAISLALITLSFSILISVSSRFPILPVRLSVRGEGD